MKSNKGLAVLVAFAFSLNSCAPALIPLDKEELARLQNQQEIVAVHYQLLPPKTQSAGNPVLPFGGPPAASGAAMLVWLLFYAATSASNKASSDNYCWPDPITEVKDRFFSSLESEAGLKNIRSIQEPPAGDDIETLKGSFGNAVVIDFKTTGCNRASGAQDLSSYSARSRLIRLEDSKIIWQGACATPKKSREETNETPNPGDAVKACAQELLAQFLAGKKGEAPQESERQKP